MDILGTVQKLAMESGFAAFFLTEGGWKNLVMILIAFVLLYLGIAKKFEPLLLCGIAFGCLLSNLSYFIGMGDNAMYHPEMWAAFLATLWRTPDCLTSSTSASRPVFILR